MFNLPKFNLTTLEWDDIQIPFRNTLLEALFPGRQFAIVHASTDPADREAMIEALSNEVGNGWQLDFASGGRKHGDFFLSHQEDGARVASHFWATAEEAIAYGGGLVTDCLATYRVRDLRVLVVKDGDHDTGDCHAKAGPQLWALLEGDEQQAVQFRLATLDGDQGHGHLAKGTAVIQRPGGPDQPYDLIVPLSAFKSFKPQPGPHTWDAHVGVVGWSDYRPTKISYTILQWFSRETIEADVWPHTETQVKQLVTAGHSTENAITYFKLDQLAGEYDEDDGLLFNILRNDVHGRLTHHPYVVDRLARLLRRRWLHCALGGGLRWTGLMGLPCDDLVDNEICAPQLPEGLTISTRYPVRSWADLKLWHNVHKPGLTNHKGIVWINHETALQVGGDFDGDYFLLTPATDFPAMTAEIQSWGDREPAEIVKVKNRLASPLDGPNLARVAMDNTDNMVGLITFFIAQANAQGRLDLVNELAPELQIAVDKFKYNLEHNVAKITTISEQLEPCAWLLDRKSRQTFISRPITTDDAQDTISHLANKVKAHWTAPKLTKRPLQEFALLFPKTQAHRQAALQLSAHYAQLIRQAMRRDDKNAFRPIFAALREWADSRQDPDEWAAAIWHAVHRRGARGSGSLAFNAFPGQVMGSIHQAPEVPTQVAIVGLKYNAYASHVKRLAGQVLDVEVRNEVLKGTLRSAAYIAGRRLGFVSNETPLQIGLYKLSLTCHNQVVYATQPC